MTRPIWRESIGDWRNDLESRLHPDIQVRVQAAAVEVRPTPRKVLQSMSRHLRRCDGLYYPTAKGHSILLYDRLSSDSALRIFAHEFAHLVVMLVYGPSVDDHGTEWRFMLRRFGYEPAREYF